jgi:patatin-like phospholipase/acyl hydrolase
MPNSPSSDAEALVCTLENLNEWLQSRLVVFSAPSVDNPSLPGEDLARDWSLEDYRLFKKRVEGAARKACQAFLEEDTERSERTFKVLAIDGGGIRGIYPAKYLAELEGEVEEPLCRYFDLITGTSTGGIIAIALGLEIPAAQVLELYKTKGAEIFSQRFPFPLRMFLRPKYRNDALIAVLKEVFSERPLGDSRVPLCIPAVDLSTGQTKVYKTRHDPRLTEDWQLPAWKVAAATSAAPLYFPAFAVHEHDAKVDGGLWANNPSLVGLVEALSLGYNLDEIMLLSIGTGEVKFYMDPCVAKKAGFVQWFCPGQSLAELLLSVQSQAVHNQIALLKPRGYKRINSLLPSNKFGLDAVKESMELEEFARQRAQETKAEVKHLFLSIRASEGPNLLRSASHAGCAA